jgi:hypothetical protein
MGVGPSRAAQPIEPSGRWQVFVGAFVALGSVATVAYAVVETFWG